MTLALISTGPAPDVQDTSCSVCGYQSVGTVSFDGEVSYFCERHAVDTIAAAILSGPSEPPTVALFDAYAYSPWTAA